MLIKDRIEKKIIDALSPSLVEVVNESHKHKGHAGDDGSGESHFKLKIVSEKFVGLSRVSRQRCVHDVLKDELKQIHALALECRTIAEN